MPSVGQAWVLLPVAGGNWFKIWGGPKAVGARYMVPSEKGVGTVGRAAGAGDGAGVGAGSRGRGVGCGGGPREGRVGAGAWAAGAREGAGLARDGSGPGRGPVWCGGALGVVC